jgi:tetratricopeptide (TPR) repeat protein
MKTTTLVLIGAGLLSGAILFLNHGTPRPAAYLQKPGAEPAVQETPIPVHHEQARTAAEDPSPVTATQPMATTSPGSAPAATTALPLPQQQAIGTLISAQATYQQKQEAWKQLKDAGKLDPAIAELEQRATANPNSAEYPATLGQAYLQKAGTLKDVREQGILGMKADQSFDAALNLEPANWEAGFWKAAALSYWPPELGKSQEVVERFVELLKVQEAQPTQPHFAQTYVLLGEQYAKQGYQDYARQTWQRGAALFPNNQTLANKLSQPSQETAAR